MAIQNVRPLTSGSILFEHQQEHNELRITLNGTSVTDGPRLISALTPVRVSPLTWDVFATPTHGVSDAIGHTASVSESAQRSNVHSS